MYAIVPSAYRSSSVLLTAVGSLRAFAFYLDGRHAEDAKFVKELLTDFNERYDKLGSDLQRVLRTDGAFDVDAQLRFIKYFNLCAEEWLFWRAGYIYDPVWRAWENGMKQYAHDPRVIALWEKERATDSYYGFDFPNGADGER